MKNDQIISVNSPSSQGEALLTLQLNEALRLIRQLQRNNAELIRQNANLMKINSRIISGKGKSIMQNSNSMEQTEEDIFVNDILSLINDHNSNITDKKPNVSDNKHTINDNIPSVIDNNPEIKDNKQNINENKPPVNDSNTEMIEINGKLYKRKPLIERLRFSYNVQKKQNLSDEELIATCKNTYVEAAKAHKEIELEIIRKVPALFYLDHEPFNRGICEEPFSKVLEAYRNLKKRNKKNTPSLVRQVKMLLFLYKNSGVKPQYIFTALNLKGITGFRYAAKLRNHGLIESYGRGIGCYYCITNAGKVFLENVSL